MISNFPSSNYSSSNYVRYGYNSLEGKNTWAYLKFNIDGALPANATLTRASLNLSPQECSSTSSPNEMYVGRVTSNWSESTITWNNKPSSTSAVSGNHACGPQQHSADVTNIVNSWRSGTPNYGFVVYGPKNGTWHRTTSTSEAVKLYLQLVYTVPDPAPPSTPPTPPATPPVTSENPGSTGNSGSAVSTPSASPSRLASEAAAPVDASIQAPVLTSVKKNNEEVNLSEGSTIEINQKDSLEILGTSFANAKIVVFIGDIAFETTADAEGKWSVVLDNSKVNISEYTVQAQAQKDGKGSEKTNLFQLKKVETKTVATKSEKKNYNTVFIVFGVLGAVLLLLILIGTLLNLKYHWIQKVTKKIKPKPQE